MSSFNEIYEKWATGLYSEAVPAKKPIVTKTQQSMGINTQQTQPQSAPNTAPQKTQGQQPAQQGQQGQQVQGQQQQAGQQQQPAQQAQQGQQGQQQAQGQQQQVDPNVQKAVQNIAANFKDMSPEQIADILYQVDPDNAPLLSAELSKAAKYAVNNKNPAGSIA